MKQCRCVPIVRSVVVLGLVSAGLSHHALAQAPQSEEAASSSSSQGPLLASSLFAPMLPDAPSVVAPTPASPAAQHHRVETSVSVGAAGNFTGTRSGTSPNQISTQSINDSPALLATFRQTFRSWLGYSVNFGYTRSTEHTLDFFNVTPTPVSLNFFIPNHVYEVSGSYIAHTGTHHGVSIFAETGAGMLVFKPGKPSANSPTSTPTDYRPLGVFGGGIDYHFNAQLALRGEYRAQVYKFADYGNGLVPRYDTVTSQPTLSLTYTFGAKHVYKQ